MTLIAGIGTAVGPIVAVVLLAALLSWFLTPRVRRIVLRYRIVDRPGSRRINVRLVPRSGGLAVAASFLVVAGGFLLINDQAHLIRVPASLRPLDVAALLLGGAVAAGLGAMDDRFNLRARSRSASGSISSTIRSARVSSASRASSRSVSRSSGSWA